MLTQSLGPGVSKDANAQKCGIGIILTELCLIDPDITRLDDNNISLRRYSIRRYSRSIYQMLLNTCAGGLLGLTMTAEPIRGEFAYFSAAINKGYNKFMVEEGSGSDVSTKNYDTKIAGENMDPTSGVIKPCCGNNECRANSRVWLFCKEPPSE